MSTFQGNTHSSFQGSALSMGKMKTFGLLSMAAIAPIGAAATRSSFLGVVDGATGSGSTNGQHEDPGNGAKIAELKSALAKAQQDNSKLQFVLTDVQASLYSVSTDLTAAKRRNQELEHQLQEHTRVTSRNADVIQQLRNQYEAELAGFNRFFATLKDTCSESQKASEQEVRQLKQQLCEANRQVCQRQGQLNVKTQEANDAIQRFCQVNGQLTTTRQHMYFAKQVGDHEISQLRMELDIKSLEARQATQQVSELQEEVEMKSENIAGSKADLQKKEDNINRLIEQGTAPHDELSSAINDAFQIAIHHARKKALYIKCAETLCTRLARAKRQEEASRVAT